MATFKCKNCTYSEIATVTVTSKVTKEPTSSTMGIRTYTATCSLKGQKYESTKTEDIPVLDTKTGDVNDNGIINIVDAQIVYDIATNGSYKGCTDFTNMPTRADVNGDGKVDALDARAIQYYVHYGKFGN